MGSKTKGQNFNARTITIHPGISFRTAELAYIKFKKERWPIVKDEYEKDTTRETSIYMERGMIYLNNELDRGTVMIYVTATSVVIKPGMEISLSKLQRLE